MGLFYSGATKNVKVRAITGYDEIVMCSPYLKQTGSAIEILLNNVVLDSEIKYNDLLICDRDAILLFLRSVTYGDEIEMDFTCPECSHESKGNFRISNIEAKEINIPPNENGEYEYILPSTLMKENPIQINFTPLRISNSNIAKDKQLLSRYMAQITSINDNRDKKFIFNFIKKIPIKDSQSLRTFMDKVEPGFDETVMHICPSCNKEMKDTVKIDEEFLSLPDDYRNSVNEECFLAYYYGKGITRNEAYEMTTIDRRWTVNRISEEIEKKNKAEQDAANKSKGKR